MYEKLCNGFRFIEKCMSFIFGRLRCRWSCTDSHHDFTFTLPAGGSKRRGNGTWTPGVEEQVQVRGGVPLGALHAHASGDGHVHLKLPHDGGGIWCDAEHHRCTLRLQNPAWPRTAATVTEGHHHQGALIGRRIGAWWKSYFLILYLSRWKNHFQERRGIISHCNKKNAMGCFYVTKTHF